MTAYLYWPVSGASVFWREADSLAKAKAALPKLRERHPCIEIERVLLLNNGARRYWRWRAGKWSHDQHYDPTEQDLARWLPTSPRVRTTGENP